MDKIRFQALVECYGAEPARWPDAERAAAISFAQNTPESAQWLAQARQLDDALEVLADVPPSRRLRTRILAHAPVRPAYAGWVWPFSSVWKPAVGMAASLILGIFAGSAQLDTPDSIGVADSYDLTTLAFATDDEDGDLTP